MLKIELDEKTDAIIILSEAADSAMAIAPGGDYPLVYANLRKLIQIDKEATGGKD